MRIPTFVRSWAANKWIEANEAKRRRHSISHLGEAMPAIFDRFCGDNHVRTVLLTRQWRFEKWKFWACIVVPLHLVVFAAGSSGAGTV